MKFRGTCAMYQSYLSEHFGERERHRRGPGAVGEMLLRPRGVGRYWRVGLKVHGGFCLGGWWR